VDLTDRVDAENVRARAKLDRLAHRVDVRDHPARLLILTAAAVASTGQASVGHVETLDTRRRNAL
jgi:hypothetical protein